MGEVPKLLEGILQVAAQLLEEGVRPHRVFLGQLSSQPYLDRECDQVLLDPVVKVPLDLPASEVRGRDDPPPGGLKCFGLPADLVQGRLQCRVQPDIV